jgi:hypothetical protein
MVLEDQQKSETAAALCFIVRLRQQMLGQLPSLFVFIFP